MDEHRSGSSGESRRGLSRGTWVLIGFAAVAAYFLYSEHRAHAIGLLPFGLLFACLVMHFFHGHGGQGGHRSRSEGGGQPPSGRAHEHEGEHP
jgi:hypothetical protein